MEQKKIKSTNFFQDGIQKFGNTKKSEERYKTKDIFFFFTFYIFIQIVWNIIRTIIYPDWIKTIDDFFLNQITDDKVKLLIFYYFDIVFINVFCPMIAIIWLLKKNSKHFMRNKFWILLYFFPGRFIIAQILSYANMNNDSFQLVTSVIIPLIVLAIYFIKNYDFVKQVKLFFNRNSLIFFIKVSIIGVISFILLLSILGGITLGIGGGNPVNESNIQNFLKNPYSITVVFFTVVIIAPFIEEFVFRESLAEVTCNKWWAWPISTMFFAFAHISRSGDWINILVYVPLGLVNGFFYYKLRNITFPILLHFGNNLIAFIGYFI